MLFEILYQLKRWFHFFKTGILQGLRAQLQYKFPEKKLKILCITGTDGKTTSSTLLYEILKASGKKVALVSTVGAYAGDTALDTGFHVTSPEPSQLYSFLKSLVDQEYEYVVLEATSHGIYQFRTWGIKPLITGVTNINHEHMDYHGTYEKYVAAKTLLLNQSKTVVLNAIDESFPKIKKVLKAGRQVIAYDTLVSLPRPIQIAIRQRFPQNYNRQNATLVVTMARLLDVPTSACVEAITSFKGVPGRWESVPNKKGLKIIIDFAHTPQAVEAVLSALRQELSKGQRLIAVFGSAGLRDASKRPIMGKHGAEIADIAIFTAEDPRTEDVWAIIRQMKTDLGDNHSKVISIADRQEAITFALRKIAKKGDTIAILGKGHERSMNYGGMEYPWSDQEAVSKALESET